MNIHVSLASCSCIIQARPLPQVREFKCLSPKAKLQFNPPSACGHELRAASGRVKLQNPAGSARTWFSTTPPKKDLQRAAGSEL
ncbi:unnamed protein product [Pleuronectes platessa]|uniref:Uncharacterized protein n=1 Tax=Pleuronectes platessa TaxID=8262 RepID=A0A9N7YSX7_PLEPL|nr:unnamed protein product [Pleuronectes platessa]